MNKTEPLNAKSFLRSIRVLYFALIVGMLSFLGVVLLISQDLKFSYDKNDPVFFANLILFMVAVPVGFYLSQWIWKRIKQDLPLNDKLMKYQSGFLIRMASCEGVGLFSLAGLLLSGNLIYLVITATILVIIYYYFPTLEKLELHLNLNQSEIEGLTNSHQHSQYYQKK